MLKLPSPSTNPLTNSKFNRFVILPALGIVISTLETLGNLPPLYFNNLSRIAFLVSSVLCLFF